MKSLIKTILKFTSIVIVLFIAIVMVINTSPFDEEINPEIQKIMHDVPMPVVKGNAYYALMGMNAHVDKNIVEAGHELILRYLENRKKGNDKLSRNDYNEILDVKKSNFSNWQREFNSCDFKTDLNCLSDSLEDLTSEYFNNLHFQTMVKRHEEILNMKIFSNFAYTTYGTPLVSYRKMLILSQIKLASSYQPQYRSEFIQHLLKDIQFWKMLLNQGGLIIDKIHSFTGIRKDIHYLSEFIRNNPITESDQLLITEMLTPLSPKELDLSKSFIAESRAFLNYIDMAETDASWYENLIFQPNASKNIFYEKQITKQIQLAQLPLEELIKVRNSGVVNSDTGYQLHYIYNFLGKTLVHYSSGAYTDYIVIGYDLNNIIKMVNIQYQAKITDQKPLQQLLSQPQYANIFNGKPFEYDEKSQLLQFKCLSHYSECKIKL